MPTDAEMLKAYLAERDVACPGCGYNLRGLALNHCPECNRTFTLEMTHSRLNNGAFTVSVSGLATGITASFAGMLPIAYAMLMFPATPAHFALFAPPTACMLFLFMVLYATVRGRFLFAGHRPVACWAFAAACWALGLIAFSIAMAPYGLFRAARVIVIKF